MGALRELVFTILVVSVSAAVVTIFVPYNSRISGYVNFLTGLIVTSVLLTPLIPFIKNIPDSKFKTTMSESGNVSVEAYTQTLIGETCDGIETELAELIYEKFDIKPIRITVECNDNIESLAVEKVEISYKENNSILFSDTYNYVKDILGKECEVNIVCEDT